MPGLVPGIHAAKLLPPISKKLIKRGISSGEAAA
jgi:hypothetical protein